jgi:haloacetate dehalogenase
VTVSLAPAESRFVAAEGVRFHLWRADPKRHRRTTPALLLHGVPQTAICWRAMVPELAKDRIVLAPDLKGLGESEMRGPYDVATMADELAALVLHEVDGPVDIVGHDWGGVLALRLATARPDLVRRLVVINAPYREIDVRRAPHVPAFAVPLLPEVAFRLSGERLVRFMLRMPWRTDPPLPEEIEEHYVGAYADPHRVEAMLAYYRAAARPAAVRAVRTVIRRATRKPRPSRTPPRFRLERSLVVWGTADPVLPVSVGESVVRNLGANASMVTLPGVGHFVPEEAAATVVPTVAEFLRAK